MGNYLSRWIPTAASDTAISVYCDHASEKLYPEFERDLNASLDFAKSKFPLVLTRVVGDGVLTKGRSPVLFLLNGRELETEPTKECLSNLRESARSGSPVFIVVLYMMGMFEFWTHEKHERGVYWVPFGKFGTLGPARSFGARMLFEDILKFEIANYGGYHKEGSLDLLGRAPSDYNTIVYVWRTPEATSVFESFEMCVENATNAEANGKFVSVVPVKTTHNLTALGELVILNFDSSGGQNLGISLDENTLSAIKKLYGNEVISPHVNIITLVRGASADLEYKYEQLDLTESFCVCFDGPRGEERISSAKGSGNSQLRFIYPNPGRHLEQ